MSLARESDWIARNPLGLKRYAAGPSKTEPPAVKTEPPIGQTDHETDHETDHHAETDHIGSREQKRLRIVAKLLLDPEMSDRQIAHAVGVSHNTVAAVRARLRQDGR
jgi:hypothetical protein